MATYDCYVRVYLPLDTDGKPQTINWGNFELQVDSADDTTEFPFDHANFLKPVFSYGSINGKGYLKIYDADETGNIFSNAFLLCKYHFNATTSQVRELIKYLNGIVSYDASKSTVQCPAYAVSGDFANFTQTRNNSFGATAVMASKLGNNVLAGIYNSEEAKQDYMTYAAWEMFDQYYTDWQFHELQK